MKCTLTLRECAHAGDGPDLGGWGTVGYKVYGLPPEEQAWIHEANGRWQILRVRDGVQGHWTGDHTSAAEALSVLQKEFQE